MSWENDLASEFKSRNNKTELGAVSGTVISVAPLRVEILGGAIVLNQDKLYVCNNVLPHNIDVDINLKSIPEHGAVSTGATIAYKDILKKNDKVVCLPADGGQKFFIIDKVVNHVST